MKCNCMSVARVPLNVIEKFIKTCSGVKAAGNVESLSEQDPEYPYDPQLFAFHDKFIKVTRKRNEIMDELCDHATVNAAIAGADLDDKAYKIIPATMYAFYNYRSGTLGQTKKFENFSETFPENVYCIFLMEKATGFHITRSKLIELAATSKLGILGTNLAKACDKAMELGFEHNDLHNGNYFFNPETSIVSLIDFRLRGNYDCWRLMRDFFFPSLVFTALGKPISECICNFFKNCPPPDYVPLSYFFLESRFLARDLRNNEDCTLMLSYEQENILLSKIMTCIRPYFSGKEKGATFEYWDKKCSDPDFIKRMRDEDYRQGCLLDFFVHKCEEEDARPILVTILTHANLEMTPWIKEMLESMLECMCEPQES
ncbi:hypothetical protein FACS1894126_3230 [Alphaproteobacteria bacterium]|nr:hypothetical protein FACS1894126_3230 [Alphaproteobacteria bacterium]